MPFWERKWEEKQVASEEESGARGGEREREGEGGLTSKSGWIAPRRATFLSLMTAFKAF